MNKIIVLFSLIFCHVASFTHAATFTYTLTHDAANRVTQVQVDESNVIDYTWQANGQLLARATVGSRLYGDVDGSGVVDPVDAIRATQISAGYYPEWVNPGADVNKDGQIGMAENLYILRHLAE